MDGYERILCRQNKQDSLKVNFCILELSILDFHIFQDFCSSKTKFLTSIEIVWPRKLFGFGD